MVSGKYDRKAELTIHLRGTGIRCGWSALHGQSQNPYIKGGVDMSDGLGGHSVCCLLFYAHPPLLTSLLF